MSSHIAKSHTVVEDHSPWWNLVFIWLSWGIATIIGWGFGWGIGSPIGKAIQEAYVNPMPGAVVGMLAQNIGRAMFGAIFGAVMGAASGLAQWIILRTFIPKIAWWGIVTLIGMTIGMAIGWPVRWLTLWVTYNSVGSMFDSIHGQTGMILGYALAGAICGTITGILQWVLLRRRPKSLLWIVTSIVGMAAGMAVGWLIERTMLGDVGVALSGAMGGVVYSAITGVMLARMLQHRTYVVKSNDTSARKQPTA